MLSQYSQELTNQSKCWFVCLSLLFCSFSRFVQLCHGVSESLQWHHRGWVPAPGLLQPCSGSTGPVQLVQEPQQLSNTRWTCVEHQPGFIGRLWQLLLSDTDWRQSAKLFSSVHRCGVWVMLDALYEKLQGCRRRKCSISWEMPDGATLKCFINQDPKIQFHKW